MGRAASAEDTAGRDDERQGEEAGEGHVARRPHGMLDGVAETIPDPVPDTDGIGHVEERPEHVRDREGERRQPPAPASGPARKRAPITNRARKTANAP